jgi:hypothetical protein
VLTGNNLQKVLDATACQALDLGSHGWNLHGKVLPAFDMKYKCLSPFALATLKIKAIDGYSGPSVIGGTCDGPELLINL